MDMEQSRGDFLEKKMVKIHIPSQDHTDQYPSRHILVNS